MMRELAQKMTGVDDQEQEWQVTAVGVDVFFM
jgi:hypothetical protein